MVDTNFVKLPLESLTRALPSAHFKLRAPITLIPFETYRLSTTLPNKSVYYGGVNSDKTINLIVQYGYITH